MLLRFFLLTAFSFSALAYDECLRHFGSIPEGHPQRVKECREILASSEIPKYAYYTAVSIAEYKRDLGLKVLRESANQKLDSKIGWACHRLSYFDVKAAANCIFESLNKEFDSKVYWLIQSMSKHNGKTTLGAIRVSANATFDVNAIRLCNIMGRTNLEEGKECLVISAGKTYSDSQLAPCFKIVRKSYRNANICLSQI